MNVRYDVRWRREHLAAITMLLLAAAGAMLWRDLSHPLRVGRQLPVDPPRAASADLLLDPNSEPAASLRRLPGLGPVRARAIVEYRQSATSPFTQPGDLQRVPGIGPLTSSRLAPYLLLPPPASNPSPSSSQPLP
ncbi:MAG: helix-hairpin-helix domain-containing protein [Gemmatimonadales bacterium]|nr:MAG: helix-hairpin-helix domain-containing protein [Gemmatimonadales bacterium]